MTEEPGFAKPRVLVTGAAGFLGSHLCDALIAQAEEDSPIHRQRGIGR